MYLLKKYQYPPIIFFKNQAICFEDLQINMFFDLSEIYSTHFLFISVFDCCFLSCNFLSCSFLRCRFFHSVSFDFPVKLITYVLGAIHKPCGQLLGFFLPPLPPLWTNMDIFNTPLKTTWTFTIPLPPNFFSSYFEKSGHEFFSSISKKSGHKL